MEQYLIPIGLILNSGIITVNRFVVKIPDWLYIGGMLCGCALIFAGVYFQKIG